MDTNTRYLTVIGAFDDASNAQQLADSLRHEDSVADASVDVVLPGQDGPDRRAMLRAEMRAESEKAVAGPGIGLFTSEQASGALAGAFAGVVMGGLLGVIVALLWNAAGSGQGVPIFLITLLFAVGGAVAGFVAGGFVKPARQGVNDVHGDTDTVPAEGRTLIVLRTSSEQAVSFATRSFHEAGAKDVRLIHEASTPR